MNALFQAHDVIISSIGLIRQKGYATYLSLPLGWRRFALDVYPHADVAFMTIAVFLMMQRFCHPPTSKSFPWTRVIVAFVLFALVALGMAYQFSWMLLAESASHTASIVAQGYDAAEVEYVSPFVLSLPMDLVFGWGQKNVTDLITSLKPVAGVALERQIDGVKAYQAYLWLDTFLAIPLYVFIHKSLLGCFYNDEDSSFFALRAPIVLGALDFYENIGHLVSTYVQIPFPSGYLHKLTSANHGKFLLFMAIIGLEVSGFVKTLGTTVSEEIETAGLASTVSASQKKGDEKRKARLEKKGKKSE